MATARYPARHEDVDRNHALLGQRNLLKFWFVFVGFLTTVCAYIHAHRARQWFVEDWLINYQAGFVRRGISGEWAHIMAKLLGLSPVWFVFSLQVSCYGVVLYTAYFLMKKRVELNIWFWAMIISPATFSFQLVDPQGGFRKEILFFAGLSGLFIMLRSKISDWKVAIFLSIWLPLTILAHEALFAYLGYYVAALILGGLSWRRVFRSVLFPLAFSAIAMYAACTHHGSPQMAAQICATLSDVDPSPCGGAVRALGETLTQGHLDLLTEMRVSSYGLTYGVTGLLAVFPIAVVIVAALRAPKTRYSAYVLCASAAAALSLSLPSYIYAKDWGRWIYIQVLTLTLFLIYLDWDEAGLRLPLSNVLLKHGMARRLAWAAMIAYATSWTLPHIPSENHFGIMQRLAGLL